MKYLFVHEHDSRNLNVTMLAKITAGFASDRYFVVGVINDDPENIKPSFLGSLLIDANNATFYATDGRILTWIPLE